MHLCSAAPAQLRRGCTASRTAVPRASLRACASSVAEPEPAVVRRLLDSSAAWQQATTSVGDGSAARVALRRCRRWEDVLGLAAEQDNGAEGWGAASAVEALCRCGRVLTVFDSRVQSQSRTARARGVAARADGRYGALSGAVLSCLPSLDLHRLDAVRSAYACLGDGAGVKAAEAALAARFEAQRRREALQAAPTADSVLSLVAQAEQAREGRAASLDGALTLLALDALARAPEGVGAQAALADDRFALLLHALHRELPAFADDRASEALHALARLRCVPPASLVEELVQVWLRRPLATGSTQMGSTDLLRTLSALRVLRVSLPPLGAAQVGRVVARKLRTCPRDKVALLCADALAAGVPWPAIADQARTRMPDALHRASSGQVRGLQVALAAAGETDATLLGALAARALELPPRMEQQAAPQQLPSTACGALCLPLRCGVRLRRSRVVACRAAPEDAVASDDAPLDLRAVAFAFAVPALGGGLFGYDIGVTSGALVSLKDAATSGTEWGPLLTPLQSGELVSTSLAAAVAASAAALTFGDRTGRRAELLAASALYATGAALMACAPDFGVLLAGRACYGAGIGFAMHAAPIYIAETAASRVRGTLISAKEAFIVGGILMGYVAGATFIGAEGGWRSMLGVSALPALMMAAGALGLPESPRWLLAAGRGEQAAEGALLQLRGASVSRATVDAELARIAAAASASASAGQAGGLGVLFAPRNVRALYVGVSLMLFQQITGQPSVLYYAVDIFRAAGFQSAQAATQVSVLLGSFKLLMTGVAVLTVDRVGRRPLLLGGVSALTAALLALAALSGDGALAQSDSAATASLACLLLYVGAYQVSFGPIAWLMVGEVFPAEVRSAAVGVATITNFAANTGVSLALPLLQAQLGQAGTYELFAALGGLAVLSIAITVPETKGKTLEQIEADFAKK